MVKLSPKNIQRAGLPTKRLLLEEFARLHRPFHLHRLIRRDSPLIGLLDLSLHLHLCEFTSQSPYLSQSRYYQGMAPHVPSTYSPYQTRGISLGVGESSMTRTGPYFGVQVFLYASSFPFYYCSSMASLIRGMNGGHLSHIQLCCIQYPCL